MTRATDANLIMAGTELLFKGMTAADVDKLLMIKTLNWYSNAKESEDSVVWFKEHFNDIPLSPLVDASVIKNAGFVCRMLKRGFPETEDIRAHLRTRLDEALAIPFPVKKEKVERDVINTPEFTETLTSFDMIVDDLLVGRHTPTEVDVSALNRFQRSNMDSYVTSMLAEISDAKHEGYSIGRSTRKQLVDFLTKIKSQLEQKKAVARLNRKPRAKKAKPATKVVEKFKFTKTWGTFTSSPPEKLVGASAALILNTKSRKLSVFVAADAKGLGVSRTSVTQYDEAKSFTKTLRKPEVMITEALTRTKSSAIKYLSEIRAQQTPVKDRSGEEWLIVKVW